MDADASGRQVPVPGLVPSTFPVLGLGTFLRQRCSPPVDVHGVAGRKFPQIVSTVTWSPLEGVPPKLERALVSGVPSRPRSENDFSLCLCVSAMGS